jgi:hypothetical protein
MRKLTSLLCAGVCLLGGCSTVKRAFRSNDVTLPPAPMIPHQSLEATATSCQKELDKLRPKFGYVPEERRGEFDSVLDIAEDMCKSLQETHDRLKSAAYQEQSYRQNMQHAQGMLVPGARVASSEEAPLSEAGDSPSEAGDLTPIQEESLVPAGPMDSDGGPLK